MCATSVNYLTESSICLHASWKRRLLEEPPRSLLACVYLAIDPVEALFGPVADDAPVFGAPLVLHAPRLRVGVDVGTTGFEGRKIATLADHTSAGVRFRAPLAAEVGLARLRRLKQGDRSQSAKQQKL